MHSTGGGRPRRTSAGGAILLISLVATATLGLSCGLDEMPVDGKQDPRGGGGDQAGGVGSGSSSGSGGQSGGGAGSSGNGSASGSGDGAGKPSTGGSSGTGTGGSTGGGTGGARSAPTGGTSGGGGGTGSGAGPDAGGGASNPADPPGVGVTIDGKFVPRSKAVVFLHIGHSNMAGRSTGPAELKPFFYDPDPRLWAYAKGAQWKAAREPLAPDKDTGNMAGPGMALLRTALMKAGPDSYFISIGHGHSGSFGGTCAGFRKGGLLYDIVMAPARELKGKVTFGGIFTMLGQSEYRFTPAVQKTLAACLAGVADEMRSDLEDPEIPFMVGDYEAGISRADIAPTSQNGMTIRAQLAMAPDKIARAALIPTDGLAMEDDHHFNMAGHQGWASRAIDLLLAKGWARWK